MNAQDLKNSILQLAVQGKLVEQRPEEGTAKELVDNIRQEQKRLIASKTIKKEKFDVNIDYDVKELPLGWCYAKIGELTSIITKQTGFDYSNTIKPNLVNVKVEGTIPLVQTKNFKGKQFDLETDYYIPLSIAEKFPKILLDGKCMLLSIVGASIGNIGIYEKNILAMIGGAICKVKLIDECLYEYLFYYLQSPLGQQEIKKNLKATAQGTITVQDVREIVVLVPPLEEQKRIVAKIEELLPYIEQYDKAYTKLETFNKKFPEDMKKSILQMAMQGRLVEQRPEEGTAGELYEQIVAEKARLIKEGKIKKEKPLAEITEDEIPFEIPVSWKWIRLGDFCSVVTGRLDANAQKSNGEYAFFTCGREVFKTDTYAFDCDAILLGGNNASGDYKIHRFEGKFNAYQRVYVINGVEKCILDYFFYVITYWLGYLKRNSQGTTTRFIKLGQVTGMLIPLPPLIEQKRIVLKLEQMLSYCDWLIK